jgi:hypothetical protein
VRKDGRSYFFAIGRPSLHSARRCERHRHGPQNGVAMEAEHQTFARGREVARLRREVTSGAVAIPRQAHIAEGGGGETARRGAAQDVWRIERAAPRG